ncbi:23S rRNA (uracil(1939)-C(5))-methyltransferase RlmD [Sodalinema gerasimenkoae]|uniref:23S rRNA (uracil(1939)-C(5))-methyltransferase RlmD n=1 Tax=Sodalinema gerasimenkoae TaxID=2862348 RepID=UPI001357FECE|nr:23S rRNA (uracil(1939)-C(5))-methyltransferase RlmD [Sodalinema gerasimenkoae]
MQQGQVVEVEITDLADGGDGVGKCGDRVVFVPDTAIGDRAQVRLVQVKRKYARGKLQDLKHESPSRQRPPCIVADKCGGCQWQHIEHPAQLAAKQNQVIQALVRIGRLDHPPVQPVQTTGESLGYRNKATYPLQVAPSGEIRAGYYQKGSHKLVNLNQCPVQDERLNPFLAQIKRDIAAQGWTIYNEQQHQGELRHLGVRVGRQTGQVLLTLVAKTGKLPELEVQAHRWLSSFDNLVGVCLNLNGDRTNAIFGKSTRTLAGQSFLQEEFAGLQFRLRSDTFFQVNTEAAELIWQAIARELNLQGHETILDTYCGIGTFSLPLAQQAKEVWGIEVHPGSVAQAQENAQLNQIENVEFYTGDVAELLAQDSPLWQAHPQEKPDIVVVDPPRQGCQPPVLEALIDLGCDRLVYISCKPSTLARDLKQLCASGYELKQVQPVDLFPQTAHIEAVAFLTRNNRTSQP